MQHFLPFPSATIWELLTRLEPNTPAQWGTMTAQHMVEHLIFPLQIGRGVLQVGVVTPEAKVERVKQLMLLGEAPLKKGFAAPFLPEGLLPLQFENLTLAIEALKKEVEEFMFFFETYSGHSSSHPVFGPLNKEEWLLFQSKHFTHHFSQFGLC
jgi:oxepin-CoA hydrolase/3-oxo-5,6-dehydrosuberyl-CoA semialdehyde dehydrogenase